jgi:hypothetical protein
MRSGLVRSSRALAVGVMLCVLVAASADAATQSSDVAIARAGVFVNSDLPAGFTASNDTQQTHTDNIRLAKGVAGCNPYVALQKTVASLPQAKSPRFVDGSRSVGNEVDVFPGERAASAALAQYGKSSIVGCLENLFEKQTRQDPDLRNALDDVVVTLDRQDIVGLGDDSVVYEGHVDLKEKDGSSKQVGVGNAAVRVGRAVDVVTYSTDGDALTEILTPALDASVARLRAALPRKPS